VLHIVLTAPPRLSYVRLADALEFFFLCLFLSGTDIYLGDGTADQRKSLHDGRSVIRTGPRPFWWRYLLGSPNAIWRSQKISPPKRNARSKNGFGGPFLSSQIPTIAT